jgi:hypothetical protein
MDFGASEFSARWYVVHPAILEVTSLEFFRRYALKRASDGTMSLHDPQSPGTPSAYADPLMDALLAKLLPTVERLTGLNLFPTYSYFRIYKRGDVLKCHRDRPACEVSVTLNLGCSSDTPWPIWIVGPLGKACVSLRPGDALIYRGCDCDHWREAFEEEYSAQVFLHYVNRDGPSAEWKFDKRSSLSSLPNL